MTTKGKLIVVGVAVVALGVVFVSGGLGSDLASSALRTVRMRAIPPTTTAPTTTAPMTTEMFTTSASYSSEELTTTTPALPTLYPQIIYSGKTSNQPGKQPASQCDNTINNYVVQLKSTFQDIMSQPIEHCAVLRDGLQDSGLDREAQLAGRADEMNAIRACEAKTTRFYASQDIALDRCVNTLKQYAVNPSHFTVQCPSCPPGSEGCQPFPIDIRKAYPDTPEKLRNASGMFYQDVQVKDENRSFIGSDGKVINYVLRTTSKILVCGANEQKQVIFQGGCKGCVENCTSLICPGDLPGEINMGPSSC